MKYLVLIFLICMPFYVNAQAWTQVADTWYFDTQMGKEPVSAMDVYAKIEGSPFLMDEFVKGSLITRDSILYRDIPLRYNVFKDEMQFMLGSENNPRVIGSPRNFNYFILDDKTFVYLSFRDGPRPAQGYFETLTGGECQILVRRRTDYAEPMGARGFDEAKPARFEQKRDTYFIRFGSSIPEEIRFNRRNILAAFGDRRDEIAGFANENNLSYRRVDDLVRMAGYYNRLTGGQHD